MRRALVLVLLVVGVLGGGSPPASADDGPWGWPLAGAQEVVRPFAPPVSRYGSGHRGVDLPGSLGAPVRASAAGRVTYAGLLAGRGVVVVTHGALRTTYEPVTASVSVGQEVALGEVVGQLEGGHLGCPVAACLHWGLRRGEEYLDPIRLVQRGPVRLLPVAGAGGGSAGGAAGFAGGAARVDHVDPLINAGVPHSARTPDMSEADVDQAEAARRPAPAPAAAEEPAFSLRAAETPLGAAAVAALVLGIGLLARPRPLPPTPVSGGVAAVAAPVLDEATGPPGDLLDLDEARVRRRPAS